MFLIKFSVTLFLVNGGVQVDFCFNKDWSELISFQMQMNANKSFSIVFKSNFE